MKRTFLINLLFLVLLNLLVKPFWIWQIDRTVQNVVGPEEYGLYFVILKFSIVLNVLLDIGITNFNNRNIAQNTGFLPSYFSNIVQIKFILAIFYALVCFTTALFIGYSDRQIYFLCFLVASQFLISFIQYLRSNLSALHLFKTDSIFSVVDKSLMIIFCSILLWGGIFSKNDFKIEWFIYAQFWSYLLTSILIFVVVLKKAKWLKLKNNFKFRANIIKQSFPFALLVMLMGIYLHIDSVMIERILPDGKHQVGIYAQSFRTLETFMMFAFLFAGLLLPIFSRMLKQKENIQDITLFSFLLLFIPSIIFTIASIFFSNEIISSLYKYDALESAKILEIIVLNFLPISAIYIFGTLLTANNNLKQLNIMAASCVVINIVLNLFLIKMFQIKGAAISSIITQSISAIWQIILAKNKLKFNTNYNIIFKIFIFTLINIAIFATIKNYFGTDWKIGLSAGLIISFILAFLLKLLDIKHFYDIIKKKI